MCHARDSAVIQIKSDNAIRSAAGRAIRKIQGAARRIDREAGSRADAALANLVRLASRNGYFHDAAGTVRLRTHIDDRLAIRRPGGRARIGGIVCKLDRIATPQQAQEYLALV